VSTRGAACPVCGEACTGFPDTTHTADYPLLPGGETSMAEEKMHTATGRMFDPAGSLAAIAGDKVPDAVWKTLTAEDQYPTTEYGGGQQAAAEASVKRAPAREKR
jgi:hypothetical protein